MLELAQATAKTVWHKPSGIGGENPAVKEKCNSFERQKDKWKSLKEEIAAHQHKKPSGSRSSRKSQIQKNKRHRK